MPVVVLSGPSFAAEVARGLPTAVVAASADAAAADAHPGALPRTVVPPLRAATTWPAWRSAAR